MNTVQLSEQAMARLRAQSRRDGRPVDMIVDEMVTTNLEPDDHELSDMERLLVYVDELDIQASETDVSERSREILNTEYVDYLAKRKTNIAGGDDK